MTPAEAILSFSQSEKVKSGLLWASHAAEMVIGLDGAEKRGAERIVGLVVDLLSNDVVLARRLVPDDAWIEVEKNIDMAKVMIRSGVTHEASYHLTQALQHVTGIGRRSMGYLKDNGYL